MKRMILAVILLSGGAVYGQTAISADGIVESRLGGFLYPDGTLQASAAMQDEVRIPIDSVPFTISEAGSYYLTGNLTMASSGNAITVEASHVTIDLMGFTLNGDGVGEVGIFMSDLLDVEIRNGSIRGFMQQPITMVQASLDAPKDGVRVIGVRVYGNGRGIELAGGPHLVQNCFVYDNGGGIFAQGSALVIGNNVRVGGVTGIGVNIGGQILGNFVHTSGGPEAIKVDSGVLIQGNTLRGSAGSGITVWEGGNVIKSNLIGGFNYGITFNSDGNLFADNCATWWAIAAYNLGSTQQRDAGGN